MSYHRLHYSHSDDDRIVLDFCYGLIRQTMASWELGLWRNCCLIIIGVSLYRLLALPSDFMPQNPANRLFIES